LTDGSLASFLLTGNAYADTGEDGVERWDGRCGVLGRFTDGVDSLHSQFNSQQFCI